MRPAGKWSVGRAYGAVVSSSPADSAFPGDAPEDTIAAYGGHLVAESIDAVHRETIAALPELIEACEAVRVVIASGTWRSATIDRLDRQLASALAKAGVT